MDVELVEEGLAVLFDEKELISLDVGRPWEI